MGRLRGLLWMIAGLMLAGVAGVVAFTTLSQAAPQIQQTLGEDAPIVNVVMAARTVSVRSVLTVEDIELKAVPAAAVPDGAIYELEEALGQLTTVDLYGGEIVVSQRLLAPNVMPGDGRLALIMVEDQVLLAIPAFDLMARVNLLQPGDQVDVLFSGEFPTLRERGGNNDDESEDEQSTFTVLENVSIAAIVDANGEPVGEGGTPEAILVTVAPQDALAVKFMIDAGGTLDLALRAPGTNRRFDTEPVDIDYMLNRYNIPYEVGE